MENPIKMDDLGVPLFSETSMFTYCFVRMVSINSIRKVLSIASATLHNRGAEMLLYF